MITITLRALILNPTFLLWIERDSRSVVKKSLTGLNSKFSFTATVCVNKAKEPSQLYYIPIARGRTHGFMPFPRTFVWSETLAASSRAWTKIANSISYNNFYVKPGFWTCIATMTWRWERERERERERKREREWERGSFFQCSHIYVYFYDNVMQSADLKSNSEEKANNPINVGDDTCRGLRK